MIGRNSERKLGTTRGLPRRSRTAVALCITDTVGKAQRAREWGGWGRISDDGSGHYNPNRSEGPWDRATWVVRMAVRDRAEVCDTERRSPVATKRTKDGGKPRGSKGMSGADLSGELWGKAPSEKPVFKPYWGKPAVRNFRGEDGDVGIIRSPVRAILLPDSWARSWHSGGSTRSRWRKPTGQRLTSNDRS